MFFFFKQKTAYELRISDWSSDVCSSDLPGRVHFVGGSMGLPETCDALAAKAHELGGVGILCNNVGIQPPTSYVPAHDLDDALWGAILTVNLQSYFWMVKRCVPMMQARGRGVIINTSRNGRAPVLTPVT